MKRSDERTFGYQTAFILLFTLFLIPSVYAAEPFGSEIGTFNNVAAYSNCSTSCVTCNNSCNSLNYIDGTYIGIKWQCVEYVRRYYYNIYGLDLASLHRGDANTFYNNAGKMGLEKIQNGATAPPAVGDILVSNGGNYGHVAIVRSVFGNQVCTIQQNFSNTDQDSNRCLSLSVNDGHFTVSGFSAMYPIKGWLRPIYSCLEIPQNGSLARIAGQGTIYWIQNGKKYHVINPFILSGMSGVPGWGHICDFSSETFDTYENGPDFIGTSSSSDGLLIKLLNDSKVYLIEGGQKRWIISETAFDEMGFDWADIIVVSQSIFNIFPEGNTIPPSERDFYILSGTLPDTEVGPGQGVVFASETSDGNDGNNSWFHSGTYSMALFPGNYDVFAHLYIPIEQGTTIVRAPVQNTTIVDEDRTLDIIMPQYDFYDIKGKVVDARGDGVAGVRVVAYDNNLFEFICQSQVTTNAAGEYACSVIGGKYRLHVDPPGDTSFPAQILYGIQVAGDVVQNILLTQSENTLSGAVIGFNGTILNGWIYASEVGGYGSAYNVVSNGAYQMTLNTAGNYSVYAYIQLSHPPNYDSSNYHEVRIQPQTINISGDTTFDVVMPPYTSYLVSGQVTDIQNNTQVNIQLRAHDQMGNFYSTAFSNGVGKYNLFLPIGTYELQVIPPPTTYPPFTIHNFVVSGDQERNIRLSLEYTLIEEAIALLPPELTLNLDVFDIINEADTLNYDIVVQGAKELLQIILHWNGSEMKLVLRRPDGTLYGEYSSTEPPIIIEVPNAEEGTWKCEITAVDVPHENYSFALVAGVTPNQPPVADADGPYSGTVGALVNFDGGGSYDPDGEIVFYEWDWDNNGSFDDKTDSATITYTWSVPFSGIIGLRVTDNEGDTAYDSAAVEITADPLDTDDDGDGFTENGGDCNDDASDVSPGVEEVCGDGIDNNCSGQTDEDCEPAIGDIDGDGDCDADDYALFRLCLGKCVGDEGFLVDVDYDGDGCITYSDYRIWYGLFKEQ